MALMQLVTLLLVMLSMAIGAIVSWVLLRRLGGRRGRGESRIVIQTVAERVRAVGKVVGLEVYAKEIVTTTCGWTWLPPLLLSPARLAMIFHFEKQYAVDLNRLGPGAVRELGPGRFRLRLPPLEGTLRLTDIAPYDIQDGRILGLLDVIQMNAARQGELMQEAQHQASRLFETSDARYQAEARRSVERQIRSLLSLFDVDVEVLWAVESATPRVPEPAPALEPAPTL